MLNSSKHKLLPAPLISARAKGKFVTINQTRTFIVVPIFGVVTKRMEYV